MLTSWGKVGLLLGITAGHLAVAKDVITSDASFYGESPAVYPSRTSNLLCSLVSWPHILARIC
jgi:hypothetical protein